MPELLDLITIGRSSVDLYGQQIGSRLEDVATFTRAVGGCPTNIAIGTARLGLRSALITRVGNEPMGRFIREQLEREGVALDGVQTDAGRLTSLVLLSVRDDTTFPLIFYRDNCADGAIEEDDVSEALVARAAAVLVTGTHFSYPAAAAAQHKAMKLARAAGHRVILDVDYRPNLWGLAGHDAGESRYIRSVAVTDRLAAVLPACDLIVGTEEELHIAGGHEETLEAIRRIRAVSAAMIVCKRGTMGCIAFPDDIPMRLDDGITGPGFPVEVYNTLGAGDAFMSGFLRGWLQGEPLEVSCRWANACGAITVSRLLCSTEMPTFIELQHFLQHGSPQRALRLDPGLAHMHAATTRRPAQDGVMALAIDHRAQLEAMADKAGAGRDRIAAFKVLALDAALRVANGQPGFGMLLDGKYGREALFRAAGQGLWLARPVELPGSRPLDFESADLGSHLVDWPVDHIVKCLCFYHPDDPEELRLRQDRELTRLGDACRTVGRELLVEVIAGKHGTLEVDTVARVMARIYDLGLRPAWWKLEAQPDRRAWAAIGSLIRVRDPFCRGIVLLGLDAPADDLARGFQAAASEPLVRGFAVGRTIFAEPAQAWLAGRISDAEATNEMAKRFAGLVEIWRSAARAEAT